MKVAFAGSNPDTAFPPPQPHLQTSISTFSHVHGCSSCARRRGAKGCHPRALKLLNTQEIWGKIHNSGYSRLRLVHSPVLTVPDPPGSMEISLLLAARGPFDPNETEVLLSKVKPCTCPCPQAHPPRAGSSQPPLALCWSPDYLLEETCQDPNYSLRRHRDVELSRATPCHEVFAPLAVLQGFRTNRTGWGRTPSHRHRAQAHTLPWGVSRPWFSASSTTSLSLSF